MRKQRWSCFVLCAWVMSWSAADMRASTWTNILNGNGSGTWGIAANWSGGVPDGVEASADFSTLDLSVDSFVTNDTARTVGSLLFGDIAAGNNWNLMGADLNLAVSSGVPTVNVINQAVTLSTRFSGNQGLAKSGAGTLVLSNTEIYSGPTVIAGGTLQLPGSLGIPSGTIAYWEFNNSTNLGADSSSRGNNLSAVSGAPIFGQGRFGNGLYLDGSSTLTTSGFPSGAPTGASAYTIAVWEKTDAGCPNNGGFVGWGTGGNSDNNLRLNGPNSIDNYWFANDFTVSGLSVNPMDGNWHAIVVTWNGTTQTMYVDGMVVGTRTPGTLPTIGGANFIVGRTTSDVNFKGWVDNLMIVNRALAPAEVAEYQEGFNSLNTLPANTAVQMSGDGVLDLNGTSQSIGSLSGDASTRIALGTSGLTVNQSGNAVFSGVIGGAGGLTKSSSGTLTLNGLNSYSGDTTVSGGTLALVASTGVFSVISNSANIIINSGSALDASGIASGFHLLGGQTLSGAGFVNGSVTVDVGATLQPSPGGIGLSTLTFSQPLALTGNTTLKINRTGTPKADRIAAPSLALGGTVTVQNAGSTPVLGDTFQLFNISGSIGDAGYFLVLPVLSAGLHWDYSQLTTNGTITVASGSPTLFNVKSYGAKGDGVANDYPAINTAIQAAIAAGPGCTVYIPGGNYLLSSGQTLVLNHANGITVQGATNTLLINGGTSDVFSIQNSSNTIVQMLKIDTQPLRFTQGVINSMTVGGTSLNVTLDSGFQPFTAPTFTNFASQQMFFWTDPNSLAFDRNLAGNLFAGATLISGNQWQVALSGSLPGTVVGKKFALWNDYGGWAMSINNCTGPIAVTDFTYYGGGAGACVGMNGNYGPITLTRITVGPPPGSGRMISASGTFTAQGNRGAITLDGCDISLTQEDTLDIGTDLAHILSTNSSTQIVVENTEPYVVGDQVQIWDWTFGSQHVRDTATLVAVSRDGSGNWVLTLDHPVPIKKTGAGPGNTNWNAQEADGIDRCIDVQDAAPYTVIRNCKFQTSGRTFVMKASHALIESNLFYQTPWNIFAAAETFWHGGPAPVDLTIRGNVFDDIDIAPIQVEVRTSTAMGTCSNIFISGNYFTNCGAHVPFADGVYAPRTDIRGAGVCLRNVTGAVVTNNYFDGIWGPPVVIQMSTNVQVLNNVAVNIHQHYWSDWNNYGCDMSAVAAITNSSAISFSGNLVSGWGPYGKKLVSLTPDVFFVQGGTNGVVLADATYNFRNMLSGLVLNNSAGSQGSSLTQSTNDGTTSQQFVLRPVTNGYVTIASTANGLVVGVNHSAEADAALDLENYLAGEDSQLWRLVAVPNSTSVWLMNKYSGMAATVQTSTLGEIVRQKLLSGDTGQQWLMVSSPAGIIADAGYASVNLSWKSLPGATSYNVKRSIHQGGPYTSVATSLSTLSYADTTVTSGVTYFYVLSANTSLGESPNSPEVSATPSIVHSLKTWFNADVITGIVGGGAVAKWNDVSGNGHDANALGNAPSYVPGAINGHSVVRFNSAGGTSFTFDRPVQDDFTILLVFQSSQNNQGVGTAFFQGAGLVNGEVGGTTSDFGSSLNASGRVIAGTGLPDTSIVSGTGFNNGLPHVVTFERTRNTGALALYVDGMLAATGTGGTESLTAPAQLVLGAITSGGGYFNGDIAEVKIFNAALPAGDRMAEENELKCKYGLGGGGAPTTPTGLAGSAGNRKISLSWTPVAGAESYNLYRSTDGVNYGLVTNVSASFVMDTSAVNGQTNDYQIAAVDGCGASTNSAAVKVFLPLPAMALNVNGSSLFLSWPDWAIDWRLYSATNLTSPIIWEWVTNTPVDSNGTFNISLPVRSEKQFFRLSTP